MIADADLITCSQKQKKNQITTYMHTKEETRQPKKEEGKQNAIATNCKIVWMYVIDHKRNSSIPHSSSRRRY